MHRSGVPFFDTGQKRERGQAQSRPLGLVLASYFGSPGSLALALASMGAEPRPLRLKGVDKSA